MSRVPCGAHRADVGPAIGLAVRDRLVDDLDDRSWKLRRGVREGARPRRRAREHHRRDVLREVHRLAAQRIEERRAERPDVALSVDLLGDAERLFGRHEGGRTDDVLRGVCGSSTHLREPEVEELDAAAVEHHHVLRLEVSVSDAFGMDRLERVHDRIRDRHHLVEGDAPAACLPKLLERLTDEELEDEVRAAVVGDAVVPDLHDTGMLDRADEVSLLEE